MSSYKNFRMIREGVKIFKIQNQRSAIDVTHILNSYREKVSKQGTDKENKEFLYAGRLCFSISSDGKYGQAYLTKSQAKALFNSVTDGTFSKTYGSGQYGFQDFGGKTKDGKHISNKLQIKLDDWKGKPKVFISIEEMPGKRDARGAYTPIGKATLRVQTMIDPDKFKEMAIECIDFIRAAEIASMMQGKPLHTLTNVDYEKVERNNVVPLSQNGAKSSEFIDASEFPKMEGKDFYNYYLKIENEYKKVKEEFDKRVAAKNNKAQ